MTDSPQPLVSMRLPDFRLLQELVWMGDTDSRHVNAERGESLRRLLADKLVTEKGGKVCCSERGRRAVTAQRYHETDELVVVLRRDLDD